MSQYYNPTHVPWPRGPTPTPQLPPNWVNARGEQPVPGFGSDAPEWQRYKSVSPPPSGDERDEDVIDVDELDPADALPIPGLGEELQVLPDIEEWEDYRWTVLQDYSAGIMSVPPSSMTFTAYGSVLDRFERPLAPQPGSSSAPVFVSPTEPPGKKACTTKSPTKLLPASPKKKKVGKPRASASAPASVAGPSSAYKKTYARPAGTRSSSRLAQKAED